MRNFDRPINQLTDAYHKLIKTKNDTPYNPELNESIEELYAVLVKLHAARDNYARLQETVVKNPKAWRAHHLMDNTKYGQTKLSANKLSEDK